MGHNDNGSASEGGSGGCQSNESKDILRRVSDDDQDAKQGEDPGAHGDLHSVARACRMVAKVV